MSFVSSLNTGVSAMKSFSDGLRVIGDNIANVNTWGFKSTRNDYGDSFSNVLRDANGGTEQAPTQLSGQLGSGVRVTGQTTDFAAEALTATGIETDLAIEGTGFFQVRDPLTEDRYFTRAGNFQPDDEGFLRSPEGYRLQGVGTLAGTDFQIPAAVNGVGLERIEFGLDDGILSLFLEDGSVVDGGQVQLATVPNQQALERVGNNLFSGFGGAGAATGAVLTGVPGRGGLGKVRSGVLELSNADLTEEFANMITTQRSFQASARIVTTADQVMQEVVNLKR